MIEILEKLYEECVKNDEWEKKYKQQRKFLISRSNIKLVFVSNNKLTKQDEQRIFDYYDAIKNLNTATDNPFFWLQFGITALNLENYSLARIHFENAYANAEKMEDFDSYQIDTHYARLLLCNEMNTNRNNKEQAMDNFYKAHKLLFDNRNSGIKLSYVLRQTGLYSEYYTTYKNLLDENEKKAYLYTAYQMTERFERYFRIKDMKKVSIEVARAYLAFRKIFKGTPYQLMIKKCDLLYNDKLPGQGWRASLS